MWRYRRIFTADVPYDKLLAISQRSEPGQIRLQVFGGARRRGQLLQGRHGIHHKQPGRIPNTRWRTPCVSYPAGSRSSRRNSTKGSAKHPAENRSAPGTGFRPETKSRTLRSGFFVSASGLFQLHERLAGHFGRLFEAHQAEHRGSHVGQDAVVHRLHAVRNDHDGAPD